MMRLVHYGREVSRSQLADRARITRSSVLGLLNELENRRLVDQVIGSATGEVGRPSTMVRASLDIVCFSVVPLYDSLLVATVGLSGRIIRRTSHEFDALPTPAQVAEKTAELIAEQRQSLPPTNLISGIGIAIPGHVRVDDGVVDSAYSLGWGAVPLASLVNELTHLPVWVDNDASLASLAEQRFGIARELRNLILLFGAVGGIGGGLVVEGQLMRGRDGFAGELGHIAVSDEVRADYGGIPGSLDSVVNRLDLLQALGLSRADDDTLARAIRQHPPGAIDALLDRQAHSLGRAIGMLMNMLNPEAVVLTGFLRVIFECRRSEVDEAVRRYALESHSSRCPVLLGTLGSDVLLVGAAELAFASLLSDPLESPLHPAGTIEQIAHNAAS
ncbi:MAG: transcriptional regulator [Microbacterium sp.]|nr:transcriptional regulator [Microbacterium sp.]